MARIALTSSFSKIPEGTHVFYCYDVSYDETFGQLDLYLYSETTGDKHRERFFFLSKDGEPNETSMSVFSYTAHALLDDFEVEDVDPAELVGHRIIADVTYQEGTNNKGQKRSYARLENKQPYDGRAVEHYWDESEFAKEWYAKQAKAEAVEGTSKPTEQDATAPATTPATAPATAQATTAAPDLNDLFATLGI